LGEEEIGNSDNGDPAVGITGMGSIYLLLRPLSFAQRACADAAEKERHVLYDFDRAELAAELRRFATESRWRANEKKAEPDIFWANDPRIPPRLKALEPTSIAVFDDRIVFECGGGLFHFGVVSRFDRESTAAVPRKSLIDYGSLLKTVESRLVRPLNYVSGSPTYSRECWDLIIEKEKAGAELTIDNQMLARSRTDRSTFSASKTSRARVRAARECLV